PAQTHHHRDRPRSRALASETRVSREFTERTAPHGQTASRLQALQREQRPRRAFQRPAARPNGLRRDVFAPGRGHRPADQSPRLHTSTTAARIAWLRNDTPTDARTVIFTPEQPLRVPIHA